MQLNDSLFETTSTEGVLNLLFGIDDNDRDNGKYRNMLLKYKYWTRWDPGPPSNWSQKTFTIEVEDLVISGNDLVCYSPNRTYTVSGYPGGSTFSWTKSANLTQVGGSTSSTYTVHALSPSTSSEGYVQVSVTKSSCNWSKQKENWVGKPAPSIVGDSIINCPVPYWFYIDESSIPFGDFQWSVGPELRISGSSTMWRCRVYGVETGGSLIYCDVTNSCGTSLAYKFVYVNCGYFMMFPNPADDHIEISIDQDKVTATELAANGGFQVSIFDSFGTLKTIKSTSDTSLKLDTSELPEGIYVVIIEYNGKNYHKEIVLKH